MFERYTEKARRVLFFARYEASQHGSRSVEVAHLVLGLLRESFATIERVSGVERATLQLAVQAFCEPTGEKIPTGVDLPLSEPSKRVLAFAADESVSLGHPHIGPEHLLLGVLRLPGPLTELLARFGIQLDSAREVLRGGDDAAVAQRNEFPEYLRTLSSLLIKMPGERREAAVRILMGLGSEYFTASGASSEGPFSYRFGKVPPAA